MCLSVKKNNTWLNGFINARLIACLNDQVDKRVRIGGLSNWHINIKKNMNKHANGLYWIWLRYQPDFQLHRHPKMICYLLNNVPLYVWNILQIDVVNCNFTFIFLKHKLPFILFFFLYLYTCANLRQIVLGMYMIPSI